MKFWASQHERRLKKMKNNCSLLSCIRITKGIFHSKKTTCLRDDEPTLNIPNVTDTRTYIYIYPSYKVIEKCCLTFNLCLIIIEQFHYSLCVYNISMYVFSMCLFKSLCLHTFRRLCLSLPVARTVSNIQLSKKKQI